MNKQQYDAKLATLREERGKIAAQIDEMRRVQQQEIQKRVAVLEAYDLILAGLAENEAPKGNGAAAPRRRAKKGAIETAILDNLTGVVSRPIEELAPEFPAGSVRKAVARLVQADKVRAVEGMRGVYAAVMLL